MLVLYWYIQIFHNASQSERLKKKQNETKQNNNKITTKKFGRNHRSWQWKEIAILESQDDLRWDSVFVSLLVCVPFIIMRESISLEKTTNTKWNGFFFLFLYCQHTNTNTHTHQQQIIPKRWLLWPCTIFRPLCVVGRCSSLFMSLLLYMDCQLLSRNKNKNAQWVIDALCVSVSIVIPYSIYV